MILVNVIKGGKTLSEDGTIQFANDLDDAIVKLVNESKIPLTVKDADGNALAEDLGKNEGVTFSEDGGGVETCKS